MNKRNLLIGLACGLAWLAPLAAEELTTVAIVDSNRVYATSFKESQAVRDFELLKKSVQDELNTYYEETKKLEAARLEAQKAGNSTEMMRLDQEIAKRNQFYAELKKVRQQQVTDTGKSLMQSESFLSEVLAAVKYVAESEGYTVVFDSTAPGLRFWSPEVDITDKVIDQLKKTRR